MRKLIVRSDTAAYPNWMVMDGPAPVLGPFRTREVAEKARLEFLDRLTKAAERRANRTDKHC